MKAAENADRLLMALERLQLTDYIAYLQDRKKLFWTNLLSGVARGFGFAVGFSLLSALLVVILQRILAKDISGFLADFLIEVKKRLSSAGLSGGAL